MSYGIKLHVWGDFALFTRPEMKVERVSYDVMTPSAARGILEAIYWKPQFRWEITAIEVLRPIRFTNIRRNEVGKKANVPSRAIMAGERGNAGLLIEDERQQSTRPWGPGAAAWFPASPCGSRCGWSRPSAMDCCRSLPAAVLPSAPSQVPKAPGHGAPP